MATAQFRYPAADKKLRSKVGPNLEMFNYSYLSTHENRDKANTTKRKQDRAELVRFKTLPFVPEEKHVDMPNDL